ncbi:hypothetical protein PFISCL1PPCAC_3159 [Pristionchus fissidentatus]|uniref:Uncharacterized protein n=1 Tax=Pristionchus fissidentatus TaxID=1538716 RepID=A0AAV5V0I6_9BILA|nr:hypothetical protein PFISCL1PPCAC_3159 [Pristionchus fissidentatus]
MKPQLPSSPGKPYSQVQAGLKPLIVSQSPENVDEPPFYERWISSAHDRALLAIIAKFEHTELKMFIAQKLFKIDSIVCDEQTRLVLIEKMLVEGRGQTTDEQEAELRRKYGRDMSTWLLDRLLTSVSDCGQLIDRATHEYNRFRTMDPLCDWVNDSPDVVSRVIRCVQQTAASMANKVGWSLLRETGHTQLPSLGIHRGVCSSRGVLFSQSIDARRGGAVGIQQELSHQGPLKVTRVRRFDESRAETNEGRGWQGVGGGRAV